MIRGATATVVLALSLGVPAIAGAHEFWIEPSSYRPNAGDAVDVTLRLGHGRDTERVARAVDGPDRFVLVGDGEETPIGGQPGADPAGRVTIPSAGCWWLAFAGARAFSSLPPAAFEDYLRKKGLEHVAADRRAQGRGERYGTEVYSRCAKALLSGRGCGGAAEARVWVAQPVGLVLELVPEAIPTRLGPGDDLPLRVLFRGEPLASALVEAMPEADRTRATRARTDAYGRVRVPLERGGRWLVSVVHMEPRDDGPEVADWQSWWASLSFELHGARWHELRYDRERFIPGVPFPVGPGGSSGGR